MVASWFAGDCLLLHLFFRFLFLCAPSVPPCLLCLSALCWDLVLARRWSSYLPLVLLVGVVVSSVFAPCYSRFALLFLPRCVGVCCMGAICCGVVAGVCLLFRRSCHASALDLSAKRQMKRDGSGVLSQPRPPRAVHSRMSQLDTQPDLAALEPRLSQADTVAAPTDEPDPSRTLEPVHESRWVTSSLTALLLPVVDPPSPPNLTAFTYRGTPPPPALSRVSGPAPSIQVVNSDLFARARLAAVQSRVAAPVVSELRAPPPPSAFESFHDVSYWCSKCLRRGFQSAKGLTRHITHHDTGSIVNKNTSALFTAIERVTCSTPSCGGLRRSGASVQSVVWTGNSRPPAVVDRRRCGWRRGWHRCTSPSCSYRRTSPRGSVCYQPTPCSTSPPVAACA